MLQHFRILLRIQFIICSEPNPFLLNFVHRRREPPGHFTTKVVEVYDPGTHRPGSKLLGGQGLPVHDPDQYPGTRGSLFLDDFLHFQMWFTFHSVSWGSAYYSIRCATRGKLAV